MSIEEKFTVPIAVSSRHIHLTEEDVDILFGKGYQLTVRNDLKQKGQFASNETVKIIGPEGTFEKVRIVGPVRAYTQLEISKTDARTLGVSAPLNYAGGATNAGVVSVVGPKGQVERSCAIVSLRHLHLSEEDGKKFDLKNKDIISVKISGDRGVILQNVVVRMDPNFVTEIHLDTDEGNAVDVAPGTFGEII